MESCKIPMTVLQDIQLMSIRLTALCLHLENSSPIQASLCIPTLASLFLSIPAYNAQDWPSGHPSSFSWTLPMLQNLAIIERYAGRPNAPLTALPSTHPFFSDLLQGHFSSIRSLLMHPMTVQVSGQHSPLCWKKMPNLQALATNFSDRDVPIYGNYLFRRVLHNSKSGSVHHLIQFHLWAVDLTALSKELQHYIQACTNLESILLVNVPSLETRSWSFHLPNNKVGKLIKLCDKRGIKLYKQDGNRRKTIS
ncbi:hypothetical protein CPB86DRAFT_174888 [Serendipita vermifera]|nr:hypothetical protein CPB86DRAFT_174888 [Serendipita vermifera]